MHLCGVVGVRISVIVDITETKAGHNRQQRTADLCSEAYRDDSLFSGVAGLMKRAALFSIHSGSSGN